MKPILKKLLIAIGFLLCSLGVYAHDFEVDGIYYQLLSKENQVAVTYYGVDYRRVPEEYKYTGSVTIPETVTYQGATYSVTLIREWAFSYCTGLTEITIPNSVTSIGEYTFSGCTGLTSVTIPNSVTRIGDDAFFECSGLTSVTIPNSVTEIDSNAFRGCTGLTSIVVEEGNTVYDSRENCNAIIEAATNTLIVGCMNTVIPNSVTSIGMCAFSGCNGLTEVTIPNSVTLISTGAFEGCTGLTEIIVKEGNTVYDSRDNCNAIIETATNTLVAGCKNTTIPNSVTSIEMYAFYGCTGLTSVTIPNGVVEIGSRAFSGCTGLSSIVVEGGNTVYDSRENCSAIIETSTNTLIAGCKNTIIPNSVTSIGYDAFLDCTRLTEVTIPNSVTLIGTGAFEGCTGLTEIIIPNSVTSIDDYAFYNCTGLTEIVIGNSVASIKMYAFYGCTGLTEVTIPNSVTSIEWGAFARCSLKKIVIPNSVTSIRSDAFACCPVLESIIVETGNVAYDSRNNCNAIIVTAFNTLVAGCKNTTIPNNVTSIGYSAFLDCTGLTEITIPNSVTVIGEGAFGYCTGLTEMRVEAINPPTIYDYAFERVDKSIPLYVPAESVEAYRTAEYWSEFTNIIGYTELAEGDKFTVDGIHYQVLPESGQVAVTYYGEDVYNVPEEYIYKGVVTIPEAVTYQGVTYSVTSIGDYAFWACKGFIEVIIGNTVTSIGDYAFYDCIGLTEVTIPNSVTSIGSRAFAYCTGLTEITIPNSVTSIGDWAFYECTGLTILNFNAENCTTMGLYSYLVFEGCTNLKTLNIGESVKIIPDYAFYDCTGLTSIVIPNSVTSIGEFAFSGCTGLIEMRVEAINPPTIYDDTFDEVDKSIPVYVPAESVEAYRTAEYWSEFTNIIGCTELSVGDKFTVDGIHYQVLPENGQVAVTFYGDEKSNVPEQYKYSGSVAVHETVVYQVSIYTVTEICDYAFASCEGLTEITIPNSVTKIGEYAFFDCEGLTEIITPNSVTLIGYSAFNGCAGLRKVTIGSNVTEIGKYAFDGCYRIKIVDSYAQVPPTIYANTFTVYANDNATLHVPQGCKEIYTEAKYWEYFFKISEDLIYTVVKDITCDNSDTPAEYYDLNGRRVVEPQKGIYIVKQGSRVKKVVL